MVANVYPSRSAESQIWSEQFGSYADVHRNGGVLTGSPVIDAAGIHLDGLTQWGVWAIAAGQLTHDAISIECWFNPDFAADDGSGHYLFHTTAGMDYTAVKLNSGGANGLLIQLGGSIIASVPLAAYQSYWKAGENNCLIISSNGSSTDAWLNRGHILVGDPSVWTPAYPTELYLGASNAGANKFVGIIHHLKIRARLLTQLDVDAIGSNSLYTYVNKSSIWLDMKEATERGGLKQTLDKSPYGRVCLLGDGSTANKIPDFLNPGFGLDGVAQYLMLPQASGVLDNAGQTIALVFRPGFAPSENATRFLMDSPTTGRNYINKNNNAGSNLLNIGLGGVVIGSVTEAVYSPHWRVNGVNVLIVASESGNTDMELNGVAIMTADVTAWTPSDPAEIYLWSGNTGTLPFLGVGNGAYFWPFKLSPLQRRDLALSMGVIP